MTLDESRFRLHGAIERKGFALQYIEVQPVVHAWAYTIGLASRFDHPEFVVVGLGPDRAASVLDAMGSMVREGNRFTPQHCLIDSTGRHTHLSEVHPNHFARGLFACWGDYFEALGGPAPKAKALEVVLPGRTIKLAKATSPIGRPTLQRAPWRQSTRRKPKRKR